MVTSPMTQGSFPKKRTVGTPSLSAEGAKIEAPKAVEPPPQKNFSILDLKQVNFGAN